jgi:hypothetical protein
MSRMIELFTYLIGILFLTYWYQISLACSQDWNTVGIVILAIYGVRCLAQSIKRWVESIARPKDPSS